MTPEELGRLVGWRVSVRDYAVLKMRCEASGLDFPMTASIEIHIDPLVENGHPIPIWREEPQPLPRSFPFRRGDK